MRIFLIGFMGSGKSYVGKRLAAQLQYTFYDLDELIEQETGTTIRDIFTGQGEDWFRQLESRVLRRSLLHERAVISCGGGTPCFFDNMRWMNQHGITIWLNPPVKVLYQRLQRKPHKRPLLAGLTSEQAWMSFLETKLAERIPFYSQAKVVYEPHGAESDAAGELLAILRDILPDAAL